MKEGSKILFNKSMKKILQNVQINNIQPQKEYHIWQKYNCNGVPFWGVGNFCGLAESTVGCDCNLTDLEWDGNEVYLCNSYKISDMVITALGIITAWKKQMQKDYTDIPFDILLCIDEGDEEISPSVTLRFWAVRNGQHYIDPIVSKLESYKQPILMEQVNYTL